VEAASLPLFTAVGSGDEGIQQADACQGKQPAAWKSRHVSSPIVAIKNATININDP